MLENWLEERTPPVHGLLRLRQRLAKREGLRHRRRWALGLAATLLLLAALITPRLSRPSQAPINLDPQGLLRDSQDAKPRLAAGQCYKLAESDQAVYYQVVTLPSKN